MTYAQPTAHNLPVEDNPYLGFGLRTKIRFVKPIKVRVRVRVRVSVKVVF